VGMLECVAPAGVVFGSRPVRATIGFFFVVFRFGFCALVVLLFICFSSLVLDYVVFFGF
jgi:hypothetical protein